MHCDSWRDITCPHCREKNKREPEDMPWRDGDEIEDECSECRKSFVIRAWTTTNWEIEDIEQ